MIDIRVEVKCNRCGVRLALVTGAGSSNIRHAINDARRWAEKAAGAVVYSKRSASHHCEFCVRQIMAGKGAA